jgi:TonB family protein
MPAASRLFRHCCLSALLCIFFLFPALHAQSTESEIYARLKDQPLYLRGCWQDDALHFDSDGHLKNNSSAVSFTLSGFELQNAHLEPGKLILEGRRIGLKLERYTQFRVPLKAEKGIRHKDELVHLEIDASPAGNYGPALDAIFANGLVDLVPTMPSYWKAYALKNFVTLGNVAPPSVPSAALGDQSPAPKLLLTTPGVTPPKLLHAKAPKFSDAAKSLKYDGSTLINCHVAADGTVVDLSFVRALGMGLDENALAVVSQYIFSPATKNGIPVPFEINVDVKFQLF